MLAAGLATGAYYLEFVAPFESTDDAFIEADVTPIAPQVAGRVAQLFVKDNQEVKQGDVLLEIDPRDYQANWIKPRANLAAAQSRLEQADAQSTADQAQVAQEQANVVAAEAQAKQAEADYKRYQAVGDLGVSASQLDLAATQARSSAAEARGGAQQGARRRGAGAPRPGQHPNAPPPKCKRAKPPSARPSSICPTRRSKRRQRAMSPIGRSKPALRPTGQALLAIVPQQVWVVANFKETQLTHMRPGQPVEVNVDAYPQLKFKGHVDSIQAGLGREFSLLPPENASGNYVKVVQRVPVKIVLDRPIPMPSSCSARACP